MVIFFIFEIEFVCFVVASDLVHNVDTMRGYQKGYALMLEFFMT